jgi:hypothetical protein
VSSAHDDDPGIWPTYNHLLGPNPIWQPFASTGRDDSQAVAEETQA